MSAVDPFLLGLFREELTTHAQTLTEGLLALEKDGAPSDPAVTEPLMRAAHSIKGASRVVDLGAVSRVAHAMEDVLLSMGKGQQPAFSGLIDQMLGALDWMVTLGDAEGNELEQRLERSESEADAWVEKIREAAASGSPGPTGNPEVEPVLVTEPLRTDRIPESPSIGQPKTILEPEQERPARSETEKNRVESPLENDASIRISAENLNQMLAHSANLLLEARRLENLVQSALRVPRRLRALGGVRGIPFSASSDNDLELAGELTELAGIIEQRDEQLAALSIRLNFLSERLHELVLKGRLRPFSEGIQGYPRMIRDLARDLGKKVDFTVLGAATLIDRDILLRLDAPLNHLLRNALDHGIEAGPERETLGKPPVARLVLEARHLNGRLQITIQDDGRGIDAEGLRRKIVERGLITEDLSRNLEGQELFAFLFLPGLSTREEVSEISGRGFGLDIVQTMVHACSGSVRVFSEPGEGTRFELYLPVTRSVVRCLRVALGESGFALPLSRVDRAIRLAPDRVEMLDGMAFFHSDQGNVALVSGRKLFGMEEMKVPPEVLSLVLFSQDGRQYALEVDALVAEMDLVVRPLDPRLGKVAHFSAVAIEADGRPILIIDVDDLIRSIDRLAGEGHPQSKARTAPARNTLKQVLVVDDSLTVREVERKLLQNAGYEVELAVDGVDGWNQLTQARFDLVVTDVDMPRMNGIDLVRKIKQDARYRDLPVIIVSYKDREEDKLLGMQAGADYYLTKSSFHDSSLLRAVSDLIGAAGGEE